MAESKREQRGHFRGKARPGRRVEVRWRKTDASAATAVTGFTKNIGVGGAFILTTEPLPPGTQLAVSIVLSGSESANPPIEVTAEVRWVVDGKGGAPTGEQGMGVRFAALEVDSLVLLTEYFASLTSTPDVQEA